LTAHRTIALTREPGPDLARCELTYLARSPIDVEKASRQHRAYRLALERLGARVETLPALPGFPDAVFVEDPVVVLDEIAVIARPAPASRRGEAESLVEALEPLRSLVRLPGPGTLEGGDVLRDGRVLYVAATSRTDRAGLDALRAVVEPHGYEVRELPLRGCLHLETACCAIGRRRFLVNPDWVDADRLDADEVVPIDPGEPYGANVLLVGDGVVLPAEHRRTRRLLDHAGIPTVPVEFSEFVKAEAGVTCACVLVPPAGG
jgi:dimethylargininase